MLGNFNYRRNLPSAVFPSLTQFAADRDFPLSISGFRLKVTYPLPARVGGKWAFDGKRNGYETFERKPHGIEFHSQSFAILMIRDKRIQINSSIFHDSFQKIKRAFCDRFPQAITKAATNCNEKSYVSIPFVVFFRRNGKRPGTS